MPLDIRKIEAEIERQDEELKQKVASFSELDVSDMSRSFGALIAINLATYQRLGDLISLTLRTGR